MTQEPGKARQFATSVVRELADPYRKQRHAEALQAEHRKLRELAEWLAAQEWMLPALRGLSDVAAKQLAEAITRAREALGRKEG